MTLGRNKGKLLRTSKTRGEGGRAAKLEKNISLNEWSILVTRVTIMLEVEHTKHQVPPPHK